MIALLLSPAPAAAGVIEDCVQSADRALQIAACTQAIDSGRWEGPELAWAYGNRGNAYQAQRDAANAVADYTRALELDPEVALTWHNRGLVFAALGDFERALADYDQALARDPAFGAAWGSRGVANRELGRHEAALGDLDRAIELDPNGARHYQNRANVRCALGDIEGSVADRVAAIGKGFFTADLVQRVLKEKGFYSGPVDGIFGEASVVALKDWTAGGCQ